MLSKSIFSIVSASRSATEANFCEKASRFAAARSRKRSDMRITVGASFAPIVLPTDPITARMSSMWSVIVAADATASFDITSPRSRACAAICLSPSEPPASIGISLRPLPPMAAMAIFARRAGSSLRWMASARSRKTCSTGRIFPAASFISIPSFWKSVKALLDVSRPLAISAICVPRSLSASSRSSGAAPACVAA